MLFWARTILTKPAHMAKHSEDRKMFKVQNTKTKKFLKDAVSGKVWLFDSIEAATMNCKSAEYYSTMNASAFNSVRAAKYIVVPA